jgi:hypothetical protein
MASLLAEVVPDRSRLVNVQHRRLQQPIDEVLVFWPQASVATLDGRERELHAAEVDRLCLAMSTAFS